MSNSASQPREFIFSFGSHTSECVEWMKPVMEKADNILIEQSAIYDPYELVSGNYKDKNMFEWDKEHEKYYHNLFPDFQKSSLQVLEELRRNGKKIYPTEKGFTASLTTTEHDLLERKYEWFLKEYGKVMKVLDKASTGESQTDFVPSSLESLPQKSDIKTRTKEIATLDNKRSEHWKHIYDNLQKSRTLDDLRKLVRKTISLTKTGATWLGLRDADRVRWIGHNLDALEGVTFVEAGALHQSLHYRLKNILEKKNIKATISPMFFISSEEKKVFGRNTKPVFTPRNELEILFLTQNFTRDRVSKKMAKDFAVRQLFRWVYDFYKNIDKYEAIKKAREKKYKDLPELLKLLQ